MNTPTISYTVKLLKNSFFDYFSPLRKAYKFISHSGPEELPTVRGPQPRDILISCTKTDVIYAREFRKNFEKKYVDRSVLVEVVTSHGDSVNQIQKVKPVVHVVILPRSKINKRLAHLVRESRRQGIRTFGINRINRHLNKKTFVGVSILKDDNENPIAAINKIVSEIGGG